MINQLKDLKDTFESIRTQIERGKEPVEDLAKMKDFLVAIVSEPALLHNNADKDFKKFFYQDLASGLFKRFSRERSRNGEYLDILSQIFENMMLVFLNDLKAGQFNHDFFDSIRGLFEYDTIFHNYNFQIPEDELKKLRSFNQEWRKELAVGDLVDAIIDENNRCTGWSQARISQIIDDTLHLEFFNDTKSTDRYLDRWSVEIAQFETKTKELFEWKQTLKINSLCDVHDKSTWNKSQILDMKEQQIAEDRTITLALIGYRVYMENGSKSDERGKYEGWSNRFDEWISIYSPRIQPYFSKTQKGQYEDTADLDEDIDAAIKPEEGMDKVYAVPRIRKCTSTLFLHIINRFGNLKGYERILEIIEKAEIGGEGEQFDLTIMADLLQCVSTPCIVYHKDFIKEYVPKLVELAKKRLKQAPEKSLRDVRREKIEQIIKSIDILQRRLLPKEERERETEILKLEVSLICLKSGFLERRIQGIRDLNQIIRNNRMMSNQSFSTIFLIEWLYENDVFTILFDPKKTHLQIVQRCSDILKLLLADDMLKQEILEMFWNLAKSDYKFEIYKIINEVGYQFKQQHMNYLFQQIKQISADKIGIEEFQCLSELGKYGKSSDFKSQVCQYFWEIICNSENYKDEIVNNCINKFSEIVKQQGLESKVKLFQELTDNLAQNKSSIPTLKLFRALIKDEKEDEQFTQYINKSPSKFDSNEQNEDDDKSAQNDNKLTLDKALTQLIKNENLIDKILDNLRYYCDSASQNNKKTSQTQQHSLNDSPRKKIFILNPKYSHQEEIDQRLQFIKYLATVCNNYSISKVELGVIYDLLVNHSVVTSDQEEFLLWCKSSCEQSTTTNQILDLNEVGQFFTEKMQSKELDLKNLPQVGFEFLQHYFLSVNEREQNLIKQKIQQIPIKKQQGMSIQYGMNKGVYGPLPPKPFSLRPATVDINGDQTPVFKVVKLPNELIQLDIVWNIALQCENNKVVPKAIDFLIQVYTQLDGDLNDQRIYIQDQLVKKCIDILSSSKDEFLIKRVIEIIKNIIYESEKKGTGNVQPHGALLKGELLEKIMIKSKATAYGTTISLSIYSNATVWQFKKEVAKQLDLAPKYLKLELARGEGREIKDIENGMTLGELGLKSNEIVNAYKIHIQENVPDAPLIGPDRNLTEKAKQIFNEWFNMYSDETGSMTKETCTLFIKGCTGEHPSVNDERIQSMFKQYDINNDGKIERKEFLQFFETACRNKPETVRENMRSHNIRNDLKKLSEIQEESSFSNKDMPRYKLSTNQDYFNIFIKILDRNDAASEASWDLIQMLATNQELYKRVLQLKSVANPVTGEIDWSKFFDSNSVYKLLYTLQIIEAVMEEGEGEDLERIVITNDDSLAAKKRIPVPPPAIVGGPVQQPQQESQIKDEKADENSVTTFNKINEQVPASSKLEKRRSVLIIEENEDKKLKSEWTLMFLEHKGFEYILKVLMEKDIQRSNQTSFNQIFELKHVAFLLKILRIFLMAAFSTSNEQTVYSVASLVRRSSSIHEDDKLDTSIDQSNILEGSRFKDLQNQLQGELGEQIINNINYKDLQAKILRFIASVLEKQAMIFEDKLIIENALSLWVSCILHKNILFNEFLQFKGENGSSIQNCDDLVLNGILFCPQEKIREEFKQSFSSLSQKIINSTQIKQIPQIYLLKLLSQKLELINKHHCKQFFELFCQLIDFYFMARSFSDDQSLLQEQAFDPKSLLAQIIDKIKEYNISQQIQNEQEVQKTSEVIEDPLERENMYIGLVQLTGKIIDNFDITFSEKIVEQKALIDEIFVKFLFASVFNQEALNDLSTLKIKPKKGMRQQVDKQQLGKRSKDAAYKLLNSLIRKSPLLMNAFLEKSLVPLVNLIKKHDSWNYCPPGSQESSQKYVGLRNLGCICYLNSMLQQFFMIPPFRYNLLSVDDKLPEDLVEYKGIRIDDNVLHQLQKLMAHLELSERQEFVPNEFCFAFKDLDGQPTNTGEQKDAQEFLNLAFDRIENLLRNTTRKYLLQSVFGGKTCSQLLCQECGKVKNRIEDFYNLSVTVKDIKSLHDSLQKLIEGEVISDYECDGCKKKVDISKRTLISQTPNVLIVHLQRIIFNFDTFQNSKINNYFEFPYQLDLRPYSFQEVMKNEKRTQKKKDHDDGDEAEDQQEEEDSQWPEEEDCFEYKLVGVNVHSGSANAGHYWSYINTKRGLDEPEEDDPNWQSTEDDPWMEFNDSTVRDFSFQKLKDDCYGGDGKSGGAGDDSWGFGGNTYGKSAYMLVYERKKKRPLKILATYEEVEEANTTSQASKTQDKIYFDSKKNEHYKLIDYRDSVSDIAANQIYKQVFEDNTKFSFENSIYSNEFFGFIKSTLSAISNLDQAGDQRQQENILVQVKQNALVVGKKIILDILAKCKYNSDIKQIVESLIDILRKDDNLCKIFMEECFKEDNCNYLMDILLECPDVTSRLNVSNLVKFILNRLKYIEKDILYETEIIQIQYKDEKTGEILTTNRNQSIALCARFIQKGLALLNTYVAKNWSKFENYLDILYSFAVGNSEQININDQNEKARQKSQEELEIGLEFFFKNNFIEKACDFMLGKKSPLIAPNEKRQEMGGSYQRPNFGPLVKLITKMITHDKLLQKYPLDEQEKKMLLHQDLLNVMLGSSQGSKQFGQCLANMCKDNEKLSKKVSKVFIKFINNSVYDNVKNYLQALKPFLKMEDSLKERKLEWVLGFSQIIARKGYREERYKYGLELVDRINDECHIYVSPLLSGPVEDALLSQLLKCKGKIDIFAVNCLKEMISLMAKDEQIARFVFKSAPSTYQTAHFSDWIRPYLEQQRAEIERNNYYNQYKNKYDILIKSLKLLELYEEKCQQFKQEELAQYEQAKTNGLEDHLAIEWLAYQNEEVIQHFPPQLIIGKQVEEDKELLVYDEDPNVKVVIYEITNEYAYSNPTGLFNLSLPHIDLRTSNYQTLSYAGYKKFQADQIKQQQDSLIKPVKASDDDDIDDLASEIQTFDTAQSPQDVNPQEQNLSQGHVEKPESPNRTGPQLQTRSWFENLRTGSVILKVCVTNKLKQKLSVCVSFKGSQTNNVNLPISFFKDSFIEADTKCIGHLVKINPTQPWGHLSVSVTTNLKNVQSHVPNITSSSFNQNTSSYTICMGCKKKNDYGQMFCDACGDSLEDYNDSSEIFYNIGV